MSYEDALKRYRKAAPGRRVLLDDAAQMAGFCADTLQYVCGAVSPKLVFNGAQSVGMNAPSLMKLSATSPLAVSELQWL